MEDEAEKMVALKRAYADIILNTAKEAAARVMVSERKALRFRHDLSSAKDQALYMLVRLKNLIDAKLNEAEITSIEQKRKIEELEAQLQEAEDVITDLRLELRQAWGQLERAKTDQVEPLNGRVTEKNASGHVSTAEPPLKSSSHPGSEPIEVPDMKEMVESGGALLKRCCNTLEEAEELSSQKSDLDSIIMSSEPEMCRNGWTQRIYVPEKSFMEDIQPSAANRESQHHELNNKWRHKEKGRFNVSSFKTKNKKTVKSLCAREVRRLAKLRALRRRQARFGKSMIASQKSLPVQLLKYCGRSSVISVLRMCSTYGNARSNEGGAPIKSETANPSDSTERLQNENQHSADEGTGKIEMERSNAIAKSSLSSVDQPAKPCPQSFIPSHCGNYLSMVNGGVKPDEVCSIKNKNQCRIRPLPRLDPGLTLIRRDMDPVSGSTSVTVSMKAINRSRVFPNAMDKGKQLTNSSDLVKEEHNGGESSALSMSSRMSLDKINGPLLNSDMSDEKATNAKIEAAPVDASSPLKYTFHRKRKKESLCDFERSTSAVKRAGCKQDDMHELGEPSMSAESSRESRRLAQVARQLISLSERRW